MEMNMMGTRRHWTPGLVVWALGYSRPARGKCGMDRVRPNSYRRVVRPLLDFERISEVHQKQTKE